MPWLPCDSLEEIKSVIGAASPMAHGQAITTTDTNTSIAIIEYKGFDTDLR